MKAITQVQGYTRVPHAPLHTLTFTPSAAPAAPATNATVSGNKPATNGAKAGAGTAPGLVRSSVLTEVWECPTLRGDQVLHAWKVLQEATTQQPIQRAQLPEIEEVKQEEDDEKKEDVDAELQWMLLQVKLSQRDPVATNTNSNTMKQTASVSAMAQSSSGAMLSSTSTRNLAAPTAIETDSLPLATYAASSSTAGFATHPSLATGKLSPSEMEPLLQVSLSSLFSQVQGLAAYAQVISSALSTLTLQPYTTRARTINADVGVFGVCVSECGVAAMTQLLELLGFTPDDEAETSQNKVGQWLQDVNDDVLNSRLRILVSCAETALQRMTVTKKGVASKTTTVTSPTQLTKNNGAYTGYIDANRDLVAEHVDLVAQQYRNGVQTSYGSTDSPTGKKQSIAAHARESRLRNISHAPVVHEKWGKSFTQPMFGGVSNGDNATVNGNTQSLTSSRNMANNTQNVQNNIYEPTLRTTDKMTTKELKKLQSLTQKQRYVSPLAPSSQTLSPSQTAAVNTTMNASNMLAATMPSGNGVARADAMAATQEALVLPPIMRVRK